jgi:23S rRNA pseudouridine2457 synthase
MSRQPGRRYEARRPPSNSPQGRTLIFCKPYRVLSSFTDPENRPALADYIPIPEVYSAGRLDYDSEGLMILTSDGRLAHRITHPRYKLAKSYWVQVEHIPDETALDQLRQGVVIQGQQTRPAEVERLSESPPLFPRSSPIRYRENVPTSWLRITLKEGRNRQIRRMTAAVGHPTLRLVRFAIGPLTLGELEPGAWRDLHATELKQLYQSLGQVG